MNPEFPEMKNDLILRAARGEKVERPPVWRQAGRYLPEYHEIAKDLDFFSKCRSPEIASAITMLPIDRYDGIIDAAIIFCDILVIPQALGMDIEMIDKKGPYFLNPLETPEDIHRLNVNFDIKKELGYVMEAITLTRKKLNGRVPLFGFSGAPWTLMAYMTRGNSKGFEKSKAWIYKYPNDCKKLLKYLTDIVIEFLALQVVAGAQIIQVFDSSAGELSSQDFKDFSLPYLGDIAKKLPQRLTELGQPLVPMVVFAKGAWYALDWLCDLGYQCISLDWTYDPKEAQKINRGRCTLQGNLDPSILFGDRDTIIQRTKKMIEDFGGGKQYLICNLGHGMLPSHHPDALETFLRACLPINIQTWLDSYADLLKPPVNNFCLWNEGFIVMVVGGPNARSDYHINETPEYFYQYKGSMTLKVVNNGKFEDICIKENEMFLLPGNTPHCPVRYENTVGIVIEQKREKDSIDRLRWYCSDCESIVHEEIFNCTNLGTQIKEKIANYENSIDLRTCKVCKKINDVNSLNI
ncbi:hypothetical protein PORY_000836 [Pneumocystis oryctolagi]|uniref:Uncharacterized protein n=1 Tax=Pneumocystis oryctolagi TaxID=42067 RepID=A0ACB7CDS1_9ASCO|nr:hypothetical protein PORY_000836 [Pneumocystis oryctolagi]